MEYHDLDSHGLRVVNFEYIFTTAYREIVKDLYTYDAFHDFNARHQDTKKIYYYHLIKTLCDYIVKSKTGNRLIIFISLKDIKCDFQYCENKRTRKGKSRSSQSDFGSFIQRFFKQIKTVLPIKVYISDVKFNTFVQYYNTNKGRYIELITNMKQCKTSTVNMERFKKFSDKYKLNYLTKHYVDCIRVKCMMYK